MIRKNPVLGTGLDGAETAVIDTDRLARKAPRINQITTSDLVEWSIFFAFGNISGLLVGVYLGGVR